MEGWRGIGRSDGMEACCDGGMEGWDGRMGRSDRTEGVMGVRRGEMRDGGVEEWTGRGMEAWRD